jgi:hypothetical protein
MLIKNKPADGTPGNKWYYSPDAPLELNPGDMLWDDSGFIQTWNGTEFVAVGNLKGAIWASGSGAPTAEPEKIGDLYLDADTGDVYQFTLDEGWGSGPIANIKGPQGDAGGGGSVNEIVIFDDFTAYPPSTTGYSKVFGGLTSINGAITQTPAMRANGIGWLLQSTANSGGQTFISIPIETGFSNDNLYNLPAYQDGMEVTMIIRFRFFQALVPSGAGDFGVLIGWGNQTQSGAGTSDGALGGIYCLQVNGVIPAGPQRNTFCLRKKTGANSSTFTTIAAVDGNVHTVKIVQKHRASQMDYEFYWDGVLIDATDNIRPLGGSSKSFLCATIWGESGISGSRGIETDFHYLKIKRTGVALAVPGE